MCERSRILRSFGGQSPGGRDFLRRRAFLACLRKAQELYVPIYLHPTFLSDFMLEYYKGNYDDKVATALSAFGWSWHASTGLHILRLYCSGLFDKYPKLKIIIGHMGELLPFQIERIIGGASRIWGRE